MMSPCTSASLANRSIGRLQRTTARQQFLPRDRCALGLDHRAEGLGFNVPLMQIRPHFIRMSKVISDRGMNVRQDQSVVGANHFLWRHPVFVLFDDNIEADSTLAHAHNAPIVQRAAADVPDRAAARN